MICERCGTELVLAPGIDYYCPNKDCKVDIGELIRLTHGETQESVYQWCHDTFPTFKGVTGRATALLEESVELAIAAGLSEEQIRAAVSVPLQKAALRTEDESDKGEIADVLICVYAYAGERGFSAEAELRKKMVINRSRTPEYYAAKTKQKRELGMVLDE